MNRAVEVLVECIPSPLVFSHPVHPSLHQQRKPCLVIFLFILVFTNGMYHSLARSEVKLNMGIFSEFRRFLARCRRKKADGFNMRTVIGSPIPNGKRRTKICKKKTETKRLSAQLSLPS